MFARRAPHVLLMLEAHVLAVLLLPLCAFGGFIDMDTPLDKRTTKSLVDKTVYHLVGTHKPSRRRECALFRQHPTIPTVYVL